MAKKTISTRLSEQAENFLLNNYETLSGGLTEVGENYPYIRLYSLRELKGKFSSQEWKYLADCLNGTLITPEFVCNATALAASVEDAKDFYNLHLKYSVDIRSLIEKIIYLTGAQVEALHAHVKKFWTNPTNLEEWSEEL